jgi:hypothetical protein
MLNDCCLKERERIKEMIKEVIKEEIKEQRMKHVSRLEHLNEHICFKIDHPNYVRKKV